LGGSWKRRNENSKGVIIKKLKGSKRKFLKVVYKIVRGKFSRKIGKATLGGEKERENKEKEAQDVSSWEGSITKKGKVHRAHRTISPGGEIEEGGVREISKLLGGKSRRTKEPR